MDALTSTCQAAVGAQAYYATLRRDSTRLVSASATAQQRLGALAHTVRQARVDVFYAVTAKNDVVYVYFALGMLLCVWLAVGAVTRSVGVLLVALVPAWLVVLTLSVVCCALMVAASALGDFCVDPVANFVLFLPNEPLVQDAARYYVTCTPTAPTAAGTAGTRVLQQGINVPSQTVLATALPTLSKERQYLAAVAQCYAGGGGGGNSAGTGSGTVPGTLARANDAVASIYNASSSVSCGAVQDAFVSAVTGPEGVCGATMTGLFALLVALFVFSGCVFAAMCSVAALTPCLRTQERHEADATAPPWHEQADRDHAVIETCSPPLSPLALAAKDGETKHSGGTAPPYSATGVVNYV